VDTGNPSTAAYLRALSKQAPDRIKKIVIMQTHLHNDHCARLADVLSFVKRAKIPTELVMSQDLSHQFSGYYMTNLRVFRNNPELKINFLADQELRHDQKTSMQAMDLVPDLLAHFVPSTGYFLQTGKTGQFFTGDINPPTPDKVAGKDIVVETSKAIIEYLKEIVFMAKLSGVETLDIYADTGHFAVKPGYLQTFKETVETLARELKLTIHLHKVHNKSTKNYALTVE
jgi:glyoxylase-like metal-dependent hydrolase (beta-lactamase superfamily II)